MTTQEKIGMSIGAVVTLLKREFPEADISISKIRFLEDQGIVEPSRTASGYRQFGSRDIERLRYCIKMQSENFLPIKVIREHLEKIDRGFIPQVNTDPEPQVPTVIGHPATVDPLALSGDTLDAVELSHEELANVGGMTVKEIVELQNQKFIGFRPGQEHFGSDALAVVKYVAQLKARGLDSRHLNPIKIAAQRQADLIESILGLGMGKASADLGESIENVNSLAALSLGLERELLSAQLRETLGTNEPKSKGELEG